MDFIIILLVYYYTARYFLVSRFILIRCLFILSNSSKFRIRQCHYYPPIVILVSMFNVQYYNVKNTLYKHSTCCLSSNKKKYFKCMNQNQDKFSYLTLAILCKQCQQPRNWGGVEVVTWCL